jgi:hypothetical protein
MKYLIIAGGVLLSAMAFAPSEASAAVCARGVARAGCVGPRGAVVVRWPVAAAPVERKCVYARNVLFCS